MPPGVFLLYLGAISRSTHAVFVAVRRYIQEGSLLQVRDKTAGAIALHVVDVCVNRIGMDSTSSLLPESVTAGFQRQSQPGEQNSLKRPVAVSSSLRNAVGRHCKSGPPSGQTGSTPEPVGRGREAGMRLGFAPALD